MFLPSVDDLIEVFSIETEKIHLIGTLTHLAENKGKVYGRIRFPDGQNLSFSSPIDDRDTLGERFRFVCRSIAKIYRADVIHQEFRLGHAVDESANHLNSTAQVLH